jgi:hypothetical protein
MLPLVAIWVLEVWDVLITCFAGALIPVVLVAMADRIRGSDRGRSAEHLWVAAAWTFASPAFALASAGQVWFTAQIFGCLFLVLYVADAFGASRPLRAGLWLAMAVTCRPAMVFAAVFFLVQWWSRDRSRQSLVRFALPLVVVGALLMLHNWLRFSDPFEFGHRFLDIRWQSRMQAHGMFSTEYLARNLRCLLALMPQVHAEAPYIRVSIHGSALWLTTPWVLALAWTPAAFTRRTGLLASAACIAIVGLLYQNSGQVQYTYRFALDWLPLVLVALLLGGAARRKRVFGSLVVVAALAHGYGSYTFLHRPSQLFVHSPLGWPFEHELEGL